MLMSEALLSLTLADLEIEHYCDEENIKYFKKYKTSKFFSSKVLENNNDLTGYEVVEHYFGKKE